MSGDKSQKVVFDAEAASSMVKELRGSFASGRTRSYEWRVSQVQALLKMVVDHEQQIIDALLSDLAKPPLETVVYEVTSSSFPCYLCSALVALLVVLLSFASFIVTIIIFNGWVISFSPLNNLNDKFLGYSGGEMRSPLQGREQLKSLFLNGICVCAYFR